MILPKAELTPSGRPKLVAGEVERLMLDKVAPSDVAFEAFLVCLPQHSCPALHRVCADSFAHTRHAGGH